MKPHGQFLINLARHLPGATAAQLLRHYFNGNVAALRSALRAAEARGYIESTIQLIRPWHPGGGPLATFRAGDPLLPAGHIAWLASRRWDPSIVPATIVRATARLVTLHGGEVRHVAAGHWSHEIALTEVFLAHRERTPEFSWSLVNARPGAGILPDAIAGDMAVEVIGRYGSATVAAKLTLAGSVNLQVW